MAIAAQSSRVSAWRKAIGSPGRVGFGGAIFRSGVEEVDLQVLFGDDAIRLWQLSAGHVVGHDRADGQVDLLAARLLDDALAAAVLLDRRVGESGTR